MQRAEEELARVKRRSERLADGNRANYAMSDDETVIDSDEPMPPAPGMEPEMPSTQKPMLAMLGGDTKKPILVPRPDAPIALADVDSFLHHFTIMKGLSDEPGDAKSSEDTVIAVLTKWNSVYTVYQDESPEASCEAGSKVGRNLATRCIIKKTAHLLLPLYTYFHNMERKAQDNILDMTEADLKDYTEWGPMSWYYLCKMERRFAKHTKAEILTIAKKYSAEFEKDERRVKVNTFMDIAAVKAIENHGGIVFGSGGGAYGGFDFVGKSEWEGRFNANALKAANGQLGGDASSSHDFMGNGQLQNIFGFGAMDAAIGGVGAGASGTQGLNPAGDVQPQAEVTSKGVEDPNSKGDGGAGGSRAYDFMGEVQLQDEYTPARAEGPPEGIGGDYFDKLAG